MENDPGTPDDSTESDLTDVDASAGEVHKIVHAVILAAISMRASDIHIDPVADAEGQEQLLVRYRVDGVLRPSEFKIPWTYRNAVMAKIKIMTMEMDITQRKHPQSARLSLRANNTPYEFRVEIAPTIYGEACVMRVLDQGSKPLEVKELGFLQDTENRFLGLLQRFGGKGNPGLVLVSGPRESGKTTTLYACLNAVKRPDVKVMTIESPVERPLKGVIQMQVNPMYNGFNYAMALRSAVRQDPDVIMIAEVGDVETATLVLETAMKGHSVLSSIHTYDAPSTLVRLLEMGLPPFYIVDTLKAVLALRLRRRLCEGCKKPQSPTAAEISVFKEHGVELPAGTESYRSDGCQACHGAGFKGRIGVHELMVLSDPLRDLILKGASAETLREVALKDGMRTLLIDGLEKVKLGLTTVREVLGGQL